MLTDVIDSSLCCIAARGAGAQAWQLGNSAARRRCRRGGPVFSTGLYWLYEMSHAALNPSRALADVTRLYFKNPLNPLVAHHLRQDRSRRRPNCSSARRGATASRNGASRPPWSAASACRFISPSVWERPFCRLLHFERVFEHAPRRPQPKVLIVAPMSGHYATLLRGTVEAFLPNHDVYITDWVDARMVPLSRGPLRSRRLHRLRDHHPAPARRRHAT